jgi:exopolyphosphatase/guanosine-5'-triphosphate,3'-diphosphate pyrophosphatase
VLLLVQEADGTLVHDEARVIGFGRGLGDEGILDPGRVVLALEVLGEFAATAESLGVPPEAVRLGATSAARRAQDIDVFSRALEGQCGLRLAVISGEWEARLSWLGATSLLESGGDSLGLIDLGGGSTEVITGSADGIETRVSLEVGSVRLTEGYLGCGVVDPQDVRPMEEHVSGVVSEGVEGTPGLALAVAGTATTLAAMDLGLWVWDPDRVHGHVLDRKTLFHLRNQLLAADPGQRRDLVKVSPERADHLAAGATVLDTVLDAWRLEACTVSIRGLRHGILMTPEWPPDAPPAGESTAGR